MMGRMGRMGLLGLWACLAVTAHGQWGGPSFGVPSGGSGSGGASSETFNAGRTRVIWEGTSLTTETAPPSGAGNTWPEQLRQIGEWRRLKDWTNAARGSRLAQEVMAQYRTNITGRWIGNPGVETTIYFAETGINEFLFGGKDGPQTWAFVSSNLLDAARDGCKVVAFTIATNCVFGGPDPNPNIRRVDYNGIIRSNSQLYDVLIDLDALFLGVGTNTDVFVDGIHYTAGTNAIIAQYVASKLNPFRPEPLNRVNGAPTNQYDGIRFGNWWMGNWAAASHTANYAFLGHAATRSNSTAPGFFVGPSGDVHANMSSGQSLTWRINGNNYVLLDADGLLKVLGGGLNIPGGALNTERVYVTNAISYLATNVAGAGTGNTNFTLQATANYQTIGSFSNVSVTAIMQGQAGYFREITMVVTNLSPDTWGFRVGSASNRWTFFSPVYGTNAPTVLTNNTKLVLRCLVEGTNVAASYDYYRPGL